MSGELTGAERETWSLARNIVNQILDESGADIDTRQRINDDCDKFVVRLLTDREAALRESLAAEIEAVGEQRQDHIYSVSFLDGLSRAARVVRGLG